MNPLVAKKDLCEAANKLLSQKGYSWDGQPKKLFSMAQKVFERKTIIQTPMGNGSR